jgi:hypothetical protein
MADRYPRVPRSLAIESAWYMPKMIVGGSPPLSKALTAVRSGVHLQVAYFIIRRAVLRSMLIPASHLFNLVTMPGCLIWDVL